MLDIANFIDMELLEHQRVTDIEVLLKERRIAPDAHDLRANSLREEWLVVRQKLVDFLTQNIADSQYIDEGRRYVAYRISEVLVKFLYAKKASNLGWGGNRIRKTNSRDTIFRVHATEHALVKEHFQDMVPDTLFVVAPFPTDRLNDSEKIRSVSPERSHFMIQECVFDAIPVYDALSSERAENPAFADSLEQFLTSYERMRSMDGFLPEYPSTRGKNVLVGRDGRVWVVDTNNLIRTRTNDGNRVKRYVQESRVDFATGQDDIIREIEGIINGLRHGLIPSNPQG